MNKSQKLRLKKLVLIISSVLLIGITYYIFVIKTGFGLSCLIYETTGILCAACGISRMFMALFNLDFISAAKSNIFFLSLLIPFIFLLIKKSIEYVKKGIFKLSKTERIIIILVVIFAIIFTVLRNLPQFSFLSPI